MEDDTPAASLPSERVDAHGDNLLRVRHLLLSALGAEETLELQHQNVVLQLHFLLNTYIRIVI